MKFKNLKICAFGFAMFAAGFTLKSNTGTILEWAHQTVTSMHEGIHTFHDILKGLESTKQHLDTKEFPDSLTGQISSISTTKQVVNIEKLLCENFDSIQNAETVILKFGFSYDSSTIQGHELKEEKDLETILQEKSSTIQKSEAYQMIMDKVAEMPNLKTLVVIGNLDWKSQEVQENWNTLQSILEKKQDIESLYLSAWNMAVLKNNLSFVKDMPHLTHFTCKNSYLTDIDDLKNSRYLIYLNLANNSITNIDSIQNNKDLETLVITNNSVSDISVINQLPNLHYVECYTNPIHSFTILHDHIEIYSDSTSIKSR